MSDYKCLACGNIFQANSNKEYIRHEKFGGCTWGVGSRLSDKKYQYWLAELDQYGTGWCKDGPHSDEQGAQTAYYLFKRLGFANGKKYAIAKVELLPVSEKEQTVNEEAIKACKDAMEAA